MKEWRRHRRARPSVLPSSAAPVRRRRRRSFWPSFDEGTVLHENISPPSALPRTATLTDTRSPRTCTPGLFPLILQTFAPTDHGFLSFFTSLFSRFFFVKSKVWFYAIWLSNTYYAAVSAKQTTHKVRICKIQRETQHRVSQQWFLFIYNLIRYIINTVNYFTYQDARLIVREQ